MPTSFYRLIAVVPGLLLAAMSSQVAAVDQVTSPMSGMYCTDGSRVFCMAVYADSVSSETVTFQMEGPADAGYISMGIGNYMVNSDIQVGWRDPDSDTIVISDRFAVDSTDPLIDVGQDLILISTSGIFTSTSNSERRLLIQFTRKRNTTDSADIPIPATTNPISFIWALGDVNARPSPITSYKATIGMHIAQGRVSMAVGIGSKPMGDEHAGHIMDPSLASSPLLLDQWASMSMGGGSSSSSSMGSMAMYFTKPNGTTILFSSWAPKTAGSYVWSAIILMAFGLTVEALATLRPLVERLVSSRTTESWIRATTRFRRNNIPEGLQWTPSTILASFAVRVVEIGIGYLLMLAAMSFDVIVFLAVVVGLALGYVIFEPVRARLRAKQVAAQPVRGDEKEAECDKESDACEGSVSTAVTTLGVAGVQSSDRNHT